MNIILFFYIPLTYCHIIEIPFYREIKNEKDLTSFLYNNIIYTNLEIGEPKQKIKTYLNFTQYYYYITDISLNGIYNKNLSKTYKLTIPFEKSYFKQDFEKGFPSSEKISLNINKKILNLEKFPFILATKAKNKLCDSIIGFNFGNKLISMDENFIYQLKQKKVISSLYFTIKYENNNKGYIIIGDLPHNYDNTLKSEFYIYTSSYFPSSINSYELKFDLVSYGNEQIEYSTLIHFNYNFYGLISNYQMKEIVDMYFFNKYISEKKCFNNTFNNNNTIYYYCNKDVDISKLKDISFFHKILNFTFVLNYKDLFVENNGKLYFLIFFENSSERKWIFGEIFFKKYQMTFEQDKKLIGFYVGRNNFSTSNTYFIIIFILILLIIGLIYIIYNLIINRPRRKKANELNEDFDYIPNELFIKMKN